MQTKQKKKTKKKVELKGGALVQKSINNASNFVQIPEVTSDKLSL